MNTIEAFSVEGLLDVRSMEAVLRPVLGARLDSADLVGGKPGHRCVVRYRAGNIEIYGKGYADPALAARTWDLMVRLHDVATVARPLALVPDRALVLSAAVTGRPLDALVGAPALDGAMEAAGAWLGALHRSGAALPRVLDTAHEAANAAIWADIVRRSQPEVGADVRRLVAALAPAPAAAGRVPLHKDFHFSHVLVGEGTVGVVDVDEARMGDPAFDVAHFGAYLDLLALRVGTDSAPWRAAFLRGYGDRIADEPIRWFTVYAFVKMAKQLATGRGVAPVPAGAERRHELTSVLALGRRWAEG